MSDLEVKVYRYYHDETMTSYSGWFYSKVYAIQGNYFLVYDDGDYSDGREVPHFLWVDYTESYEDECNKTYHYLVELKEQK